MADDLADDVAYTKPLPRQEGPVPAADEARGDPAGAVDALERQIEVERGPLPVPADEAGPPGAEPPD